MDGLPTMLSSSAMPTPTPTPAQREKEKAFSPQSASSATMPIPGPRPSLDRNDGSNLQLPAAPSVRTVSTSAVSFAPRGSSLNPSSITGPGSFSSDLRSQLGPSRAGSRLDIYNSLGTLDEAVVDTNTEKLLADLREDLARENKIKEGSENMLEALNSKKAKQVKEQKAKVEAELNTSYIRIRRLKQKIEELEQAKATPTTPIRTPGEFFPAKGMRSPQSASRSGAGSDVEEAVDPTFRLGELLQSLEVEGLTPEYYVAKANSLVDLFKKHPILKYDLVWSVFGLKVQVMLLSESREVVAAGYRMTRYAISDRSSLKKIRTLNTDYIVISSLIKDRKADLEREQALKFVRAFLDIKDGTQELSRAVVRTIVSIAEHSDDRLRPICLQTLAEILVRDPQLLLASGGFGVLCDALTEGSYKAPESLISAYLFLLDSPQRRKYLRPGYDLEVIFNVFTDVFMSNESIMKHNSKAIASALRTWPGLMYLSMYNFRAIRSLISSLILPNQQARDIVIDLLYSLLRIKSPAWATPFLAGRRLTTYGRVTTMTAPKPVASKGTQTYVDDDGGEQNFVEHYTALLLATLVRSDLVPTLLNLAQDAGDDDTLRRKSTLLLGEVLRLSSRLLPPLWSTELQLLPDLFSAAIRFKQESHFVATGLVYQISSVSRTLYRSIPTVVSAGGPPSRQVATLDLEEDQPRSATNVNVDEGTFRQLLVDSGVLSSSNFLKWNWEVILKLIEGPLTVGKRIDEAIRASKFMKRVMGFYRPFKYRFADTKNTRNTQKYIKVGCTLMHTLLQSAPGIAYLADNKVLRQIAECLAQCDPTSGITARVPLFSRDRLTDTLSGGYFAMLGVLSGDAKGLQMMERWRMFNMMYHILDHKQRPDLVKLMLSSFDYSVYGHPRVLLQQAMTAGTKEIRIHATNIIRKFASSPKASMASSLKWATELLVNQLYDPEVEVSATAIKILEKLCNKENYLEAIVECHPALDHLGEIGAPLLLRFLSTSIGYHYLDGLDYISNEMDDWFLGRNDTYVRTVEASLARAFADGQDEPANRLSLLDDEADAEADPHVPPHFYRELTRTEEGCKLLKDKGHFQEFANTIREYGMQADDVEIMTKVKGCMWAVGNVGSMERGAPFLESCDVVEHIVKIAEHHQVMGMRGTAFFVVGLISRSVHGLEILSELGWDANSNSLGFSTGFCVPNNLSRFLSLAPWQHETSGSVMLPATQRTESSKAPSMPSRARSDSLLEAMGAPSSDYMFVNTGAYEDDEKPVELDPDPLNQKILENFIDLSNTVRFSKARNDLVQLKEQKKPPGFASPQLFRRVVALMEAHHYRLNARRMLELFERSVLRQVVLEEDVNDDGKDVKGPMELPSTRVPEQLSGDEKIDRPQEEQSGEEAHGEGEGMSSGDEQRTERQRSISDPTELEPRAGKTGRFMI